ncbi:MAG: hypothetical protein WCY95_01160, partial [Castellaniella sp.]
MLPDFLAGLRRSFAPKREGGRDDMIGEATWALSQQRTRGSRLLIWMSLLTMGVLIAWASTANIDEVVRGEGKVVPSRQVQ